MVRIGGLGIFQAGVEVLGFVVLDVGGVLGHQARESGVEGFEQRCAAAEVGLEINDHTGIGLGRAEAGLPLEETMGLGEAETVDGLFHIAYREKIGWRGGEAFGADQREDRVLNFVDVLVFIDQHVAETAVQKAGDWGRG